MVVHQERIAEFISLIYCINQKYEIFKNVYCRYEREVSYKIC